MILRVSLIRTRRQRGKRDKQRVKDDDKIAAACFDLKEVLLTHHSTANAMFYKRRIAPTPSLSMNMVQKMVIPTPTP